MALSNSQYNEVMRGYERRQSANRQDQQRRRQEVYDRVPQIRALDQAVASCGAARARQALEGDTKARARLREELADLREQKEILLLAAGFPADYMDMRYQCPDCKDTGYAGGRRCHCFEEARMHILYAQSNIRETLERENFLTLSLEWYDNERKFPELGMTELEYMKRVIGQCRDFAESFPEKGRNILFTGGTGVGKTFLTNCISKTLIDRYLSVIYLSSQDLFDLLSRHKFNRDLPEDIEETCRHILDCDMLIIDDLGTELNNAFVSSQLFYCVNERINRQKGTIISTNLSLGMLRDAYSDRVTSRLMSHYVTIPLYGGDIRMRKRKPKTSGD